MNDYKTKKALTAVGSDLITLQEMKMLVDEAVRNALILDAVEVYKIEGSLEKPCIAESIYGGEYVAELAALSHSQRVERMAAEGARLVSRLSALPDSYMVKAWLVPSLD